MTTTPRRITLLAAICVVLATTLSGAASASHSPSPTMMCPVEPCQVRRLFDPPPQPWLAGHRGIDLAAEVHQEVSAPASGTVTFADWVVDRPVITVTHVNGLRSSLEPVESDLEVGTRVSPGQVLGTVSTSTHCEGGCVHWGIRDGQAYVNPLDWLAGYGPVRLLPVA